MSNVFVRFVTLLQKEHKHYFHKGCGKYPGDHNNRNQITIACLAVEFCKFVF